MDCAVGSTHPALRYRTLPLLRAGLGHPRPPLPQHVNTHSTTHPPTHPPAPRVYGTGTYHSFGDVHSGVRVVADLLPCGLRARFQAPALAKPAHNVCVRAATALARRGPGGLGAGGMRAARHTGSEARARERQRCHRGARGTAWRGADGPCHLPRRAGWRHRRLTLSRSCSCSEWRKGGRGQRKRGGVRVGRNPGTCVETRPASRRGTRGN